jgi:excinuclease UvrABC nuclease subunit
VLTTRLEFSPQRDAEFFAATPTAPAVFVLRGDDPQAEPYVSKTANLRRRLQRLLGAPTAHSKRLNLRERVCVVEFSPTGSDFESGFLLYKVLRTEFPKTYTARLRLRPAPMVKLHLQNPYPRASVTTRVGKLEGGSLYYGPFFSRVAADKFANDSLDLFKMRRCVDDLNPDPKFPGCIYSEMKMCLAPCFKGCTDEEYQGEVSRVRAYLDSGGHSLVREISEERDRASVDLEFEKAADLHARIEKLKPILAQLPEIVRRLDQMTAVIIQPSFVLESVTFFRVDAGCIAGPATFSIQTSEHTKSQSMESRIQQALAAIAPTEVHSANERMEHLAILKRWYYRGTRKGEIFIADRKGELPFRRIVRGVSRVYHGEPVEESEVRIGSSIPTTIDLPVRQSETGERS